MYLLIVLFTPFIAGLGEEYIFGNDQSDSYFRKNYNIHYIEVYALAAIMMIIFYESFGTNNIGNLIFLSVITTIIFVIGECIVGIMLDTYGKKVWNYYEWENEYMIPFCNGHNSVIISIIIFILTFLFYNMLAFINHK